MKVQTLTPTDQRATDARLLAANATVGRRLDPRDPRQVRQAAVGLVSQLFFAPLLAEMRKTPFGTEFGGGGRGEEVFGEQLDLRLADAAAASDSSGLVRQISAKLSRRGGPPAAAPSPTANLWGPLARARGLSA
jgi:hypothetical protein